MPYLTAAEVGALRPRIADRPTVLIDNYVEQFETYAERKIGVAFLSRAATYRATPRNGWLELPNYEVTEITSITDDDAVTYTEETLDTRRGRIQLSAWCPVTVVYEHGFTEPTALIKSACARWVERMIVADESGTSRDVLAQANDGATTRYSTPDWDAGRPTGFLQIDADLNAERSRLVRIY